jgi:hypothetical protein
MKKRRSKQLYHTIPNVSSYDDQHFLSFSHESIAALLACLLLQPLLSDCLYTCKKHIQDVYTFSATIEQRRAVEVRRSEKKKEI